MLFSKNEAQALADAKLVYRCTDPQCLEWHPKEGVTQKQIEDTLGRPVPEAHAEISVMKAGRTVKKLLDETLGMRRDSPEFAEKIKAAGNDIPDHFIEMATRELLQRNIARVIVYCDRIEQAIVDGDHLYAIRIAAALKVDSLPPADIVASPIMSDFLAEMQKFVEVLRKDFSVR